MCVSVTVRAYTSKANFILLFMYRQQQWRQVTEVELCLVVAHPQASEDSLHDNIIQKNGNNLQIAGNELLR